MFSWAKNKKTSFLPILVYILTTSPAQCSGQQWQLLPPHSFLHFNICLENISFLTLWPWDWQVLAHKLFAWYLIKKEPWKYLSSIWRSPDSYYPPTLVYIFCDTVHYCLMRSCLNMEKDTLWIAGIFSNSLSIHQSIELQSNIANCVTIRIANSDTVSEVKF